MEPHTNLCHVQPNPERLAKIWIIAQILCVPALTYLQLAYAFAIYDVVSVSPIWWLAMLTPHSRRTIAIPLAFLLTSMIIQVFLAAVYNWRQPHLWQFFWSYFGGWVGFWTTFYVLSKLTGLHLVQHGQRPTFQPLTTGRLVAITALVAAMLTAGNLPEDKSISIDIQLNSISWATLQAMGYAQMGLIWIALTAAYWKRSVLTMVLVVIGLQACMLVVQPIYEWLFEQIVRGPTKVGNVSQLSAVLGGLTHCIAILFLLRLLHLSGYEIARLKPITKSADSDTNLMHAHPLDEPDMPA